MNNLLSNCGLVDAKIRASDKDLPILVKTNLFVRFLVESSAFQFVFEIN
jgi:hypothetical protein